MIDVIDCQYNRAFGLTAFAVGEKI